jgi:hypothetical protein
MNICNKLECLYLAVAIRQRQNFFQLQTFFRIFTFFQNLKKAERDSQGKDRQISKSLREAGNEAFK